MTLAAAVGTNGILPSDLTAAIEALASLDEESLWRVSYSQQTVEDGILLDTLVDKRRRQGLSPAEELLLADPGDRPHGRAHLRGGAAGRVRLRAGTLYAALDRLRLDGLIDVDREEIVENRLRRYYRLTPAGSGELAAEAARVQSNAATALARLGRAGEIAR